MNIEQLLEERRSDKGSIAYNAALQSSRGFMFAQGNRPASNEGHKNASAFMSSMVDKQQESLITYFDRMRVKSHQVTYDATGAKPLIQED